MKIAITAQHCFFEASTIQLDYLFYNIAKWYSTRALRMP